MLVRFSSLVSVHILYKDDLALSGPKTSFERTEIGDHFLGLTRFWTSIYMDFHEMYFSTKTPQSSIYSRTLNEFKFEDSLVWIISCTTSISI